MTSPLPKLFVNGEPGALLGEGATLDECWGGPAQAEVSVPGIHFLQEDSPHEIGRAVADWLPHLA